MAINHNSLGEQVYLQLRADIISGKIPAGKKLLLKEIQSELGVSVTPVREALSRLAQDSFVEHATNQGARVIELAPKDICELLDVRHLYDRQAVAVITAFNDRTVPVAALNESIDRQKKFHAKPQYKKDEYNELCYNFHEVLCSFTKNDWLIKSSKQYHSLLLLADRRLQINDYPLEAISEHEAIVSAIAKGDCALALDALIFHLEQEKRRFGILL